MPEHFNSAIWVSPTPAVRHEFIEAIIEAAKPFIGHPDRVNCLNYVLQTELSESWDAAAALLEKDLHDELLFVYLKPRTDGLSGERSEVCIDESATDAVYTLSLMQSDFEGENFFEELKALAIRLYQTAGKFADVYLVVAGYEFEINSAGGDLHSTLKNALLEPARIEIILCPGNERVDSSVGKFEKIVTPEYQMIWKRYE